MLRLICILYLILLFPLQAKVQTSFPWTADIPAAIAQDYREPLQFLDEKSCDWRETLQKLMLPYIGDCTSAKEVVLCLAPQMTKITAVSYSTQRSAACLNPLQSLEEKKASCTGLSILFAASMRSLGIPARIVGVLTWNHTAGNHTWTEVWLDGEWHMIEFNEKTFNTPWVMDALCKLDPKEKTQRVMAIQPSAEDSPDNFFPLAWAPQNHSIKAVDVSERYRQLAHQWYQKKKRPANSQQILIDFQPRPRVAQKAQLCDEKGQVICEGLLPHQGDDMRKMLSLELPRQSGKNFYLLLENGLKHKISPTEAPVQVLHIRE